MKATLRLYQGCIKALLRHYLNVVGVLRYPVMLAHQIVDERVRKHVVSRSAHNVYCL